MSIALTLSALNYLPVKLADIHNDFITAPVTYKMRKVLDQEFVKDYERKAILVWSLYGFKSAGAAFRNHLADCMNHLVFLPYPNDLDLWMKPMVRPENGFEYYANLLIYVENLMVIHHDADSLLR